MATSSLNCDLCDREQVTKPAEEYCPQCDDALCIDCKKYHKLSKATRTHDTVTIDEFQKLPPFIRKIKQSCEEHGDTLEFFCPIHDELCCKFCTLFIHKKCNETVFIPEIVKTIDLSSQFDHFLKTIDDVEKNLKLAIEDRQKNLSDLEQQKNAIINGVKQKKEEIINHLNKIEEELIQSLSETYENTKLEIEKLVDEMKDKSEEGVSLKEEIHAIKKYASNVQLFMGSKELVKTVASLNKYIISIFENGSFDRTNFVLSNNEQMNNITNDVRSFGTISITNNSSTVRFHWEEEKAAQTMTLKKKIVRDIHLELKHKLNLGNIGACIILNDSNIIVGKTDSRGMLDVIKYTMNGQFISKLLIENSCCYDIVSVNEDTVAVTGGNVSHNIYVVDVNSWTIVKVLRCNDWNYGATFHDGSLICCTHDSGIRRIDIETEKYTTILSGSFNTTCIVSDDNYLYLSDHRTNSIICYDFSRNTKWTYQNEILKSPRGITIDSYSTLYVAGYESNNVVMISSHGKQGSQLLGQDDGMCNPTRAHVNKENNILLVRNIGGSVYLYDLKI